MAVTDTLENKVNDDIIDIVIPEVRKQRFRIDGDNARILELDVSDMSIITRLDNTYRKLTALMEEVANNLDVSDDDTGIEIIEKTSDSLQTIDTKMRNLIDELFGTNVSEVCVPSGSMYDLYNGKYRFEHILEVLFGLYEDNITKEYEKLKSRVSKHTDKYTRK